MSYTNTEVPSSVLTQMYKLDRHVVGQGSDYELGAGSREDADDLQVLALHFARRHLVHAQRASI